MTDRDTEPEDTGPRGSGPRPLPQDALDALLAGAARRPPPPLPDGLRARLLADALAQMPPPARAGAPRRRPGHLQRLWQALGGAPGLAGLTAAGLAGFWIGVAPPDTASGLSTAFWQGAALIGPDLADWTADTPEGFDDDPLLALLTGD